MNETGPARHDRFLDSGAVARLLESPEGFDPRPATAILGRTEAPRLRVLSIGPGEVAVELLPDGAQAGFLLDLDPSGWRSEWGGLLLLQREEGRLFGYRPVPGALTGFLAADRPMLSLVTPQGRRRTSILGWWF